MNSSKSGPSFKGFAARPRKPMTVSQDDLVSTRFLDPENAYGWVVEPKVERFDIEAWVRQNRERLEQKLLKHGAVLLSGCGVDSVDRFQRLTELVTPDLLDYLERAAPRNEVGAKVFTSTEYPADQVIPMHHEMSYSHNWPVKLWFYCAQAAKEGGCTPLTNDRQVLEAIDPDIREEFVAKKIMYVRNFGEGVDMPWQVAFQTEDRAEVEAYCAKARMTCEWREGDRLRTRAVRQVLATHPKTGDTVWFNHAHLFHISNMGEKVRAALLEEFALDELPRNAFFGDGTPIETEKLDHIREVYQRLSLRFPWKTGDVLLVDNFLSSHGRDPFVGPRKVLVTMAELYTSDVDGATTATA